MKKEGKNIAKAHASVEKRPYTLQMRFLCCRSQVRKVRRDRRNHPALGVDPSTPTRWCAARWFCRTGWASRKRFWSIASGDKIREAEAAGADYAGRRRDGREDHQRELDRLRCADRHSGRDEIRRTAGQDSWAKGSDAESENGHRLPSIGQRPCRK